MSVNKFMHSRNIYKTPPDFAKLADLYPEFEEISLKDDKGKVHIDFKDPHVLRILTKCLLHRDFGLNVSIPEDRLVPTLPLRLNYILWIEDLLSALDIGNQVTGIDIGTGACAIYPLLAAAKNKWHMLGTEKDETSFKTALDNVKNNNLEHMISLKFNKTESLLQYCFIEENSVKYDFSMCNPPFYSSFEELCESRSTARPPPKNAFTGSLPELITEGGEVEFITRIIDESVTLQENIRVFTTMVGHKASLKELMLLLRERGIQHTHTEFCQGHTTRWGLAWTFLVTCDLQLVSPKTESRKKNTCMAFVMQPIPGMKYDSESLYVKVKDILNNLRITYKLFKKKGQRISLEIKAYTNTWSNQRRKRRQERREMDLAKKIKLSNDIKTNNSNKEDSFNGKDIKHDEVLHVDIKNKNILNCIMVKSDYNDNTENEKTHINDKLKNCLPKDNLDNNENANIKQTEQSNNVSSTAEVTNVNCLNISKELLSTTSKKVECISESSTNTEIILHAILSICKMESDIVLDMEYLSGSAGKDGMHQVVQYIKNN